MMLLCLLFNTGFVYILPFFKGLYLLSLLLVLPRFVVVVARLRVCLVLVVFAL